MKGKLVLNRRRFLKSAGAAAVVGMAGMMGMPRGANAGEGGLATLIDLTLCNGCGGKDIPACVSACRTIQQGRTPEPVDPIPVPFPTRKVEDWSKRREVADRLTPYNRIFVQRAEVERDGRRQTVFIPRRFMHCDNPACATICPFAANHKFKNGAVVIDPDTCFGGAKCKTVCPWQIPQRQSGVGVYLKVLPTLMGNGIMVKCDLCNHLLGAGGIPACIEVCPQKALSIGPRGQIFAEAEHRASMISGFVYGKAENGGTSTLYISPVSFDLMDRSVEKGPGRPGLAAVQRRMAQTDGLGKAVMAAPAVGLVAGLAGVFSLLSKRKEQTREEE